MARRADCGMAPFKSSTGRPITSVRRCAKLTPSRQATARLRSSVSSRVNRAGMTSMVDIAASPDRGTFPGLAEYRTQRSFAKLERSRKIKRKR
jgi:hypothetical protein